jgi:hypothetical protein
MGKALADLFLRAKLIAFPGLPVRARLFAFLQKMDSHS